MRSILCRICIILIVAKIIAINTGRLFDIDNGILFVAIALLGIKVLRYVGNVVE